MCCGTTVGTSAIGTEPRGSGATARLGRLLSSSSERALHQYRWPICQPLLWHCLLQYLALRHRRHLANSRGNNSHRPQYMLAHWRMPPRDSSFRHALRITTPAQYWISGPRRGNSMYSTPWWRDGRSVKYSAIENTLNRTGSSGLHGRFGRVSSCHMG